MKKKKIVILLISIILIIAIIVVASIVVNNKKNNNDIDNNDINNNDIDIDNNESFIPDKIETTYLEGTFSDVDVTDEESAKQAINDIIEDLPINSVDELKYDSKNNGSTFTIYNFVQTYQGIEVYDSAISIYTDLNNKVHGGIHTLRKITGDYTIQTSDTEIDEIIKDKTKDKIKDLSSMKIEINPYIYSIKGEYVLAHKCEINEGPPFSYYYEIIIRDSDKKILSEEEGSNIWYN